MNRKPLNGLRKDWKKEKKIIIQVKDSQLFN